MAASILYDRIKVSTSTVGTGNVVVGDAQSTFMNFVEGGVEEGDQISYLIEDNLGWEIGTGIYTASTGSFTRNVSRSSSANAAISLSGSAIVSLTALASDLVTLDNPQTLTSKTLISATITGSTGASPALSVSGTATGGITVFGVHNTATIASDVTSSYTSFRSAPSTEAEAFTLGTLRHFAAVGATEGAGSGLTVQEAFYVNSNMTTAANNYGFVGALASNATSWNFYASGTAQNAFAGNTRFGSTTVPTATVDITGTLAVSGTVSGAGFTTYLASPPAIGGTTAAAITGTTITANTGLVGPHNGTVGATTPTTGAFTTVTASTSVLSDGTGGVGYASGAGGTVTQVGSRTTGVTLNKLCGRITLFSNTTTAGTFASFTVTNSTVESTDVVIVNIGSGATVNSYSVTVSAVASGSFRVQIANVAAVAVAEAPVLNFSVIKAVSA